LIDFILSKFGILLFALAMASILLYFSGNIKNVFLSDETIQISNTVVKQINYMAQSDNLCASTKVILPKYIDIFGISSTPTFSSIYYLMDINVIGSNNNSNDNFVVFSIYDKQTKKQIALESFRTSSDVSLQVPLTNKETNGITIDPTKHQVIYMVKTKSVEQGSLQTKIYFVNCDYDDKATEILGGSAFDSCYKQLMKLQTSQPNSQSTNYYPFFCVPTPSAEHQTH